MDQIVNRLAAPSDPPAYFPNRVEFFTTPFICYCCAHAGILGGVSGHVKVKPDKSKNFALKRRKSGLYADSWLSERLSRVQNRHSGNCKQRTHRQTDSRL